MKEMRSQANKEDVNKQSRKRNRGIDASTCILIIQVCIYGHDDRFIYQRKNLESR